MFWDLNTGMATSQLTASLVTVSTRNLASFEDLRPSTVKFSSFGTLKPGAFTHRPFKGLVVKAATAVAPKAIPVIILLFVLLLMGKV